MRDIPFNKDVYNGVVGDVTTLYKIIKHITNILFYYNPTSDFFDDTENFAYELCHWYEDTMPAPSGSVSPLEYSATYPNAFMGLEYTDDGGVESSDPISAYEVLEQLMKTFGMRIFQKNGYWWLMNIEQYAHLDDGILYYRRFNKNGSRIGGGTSNAANFVKELGSAGGVDTCVKLAGSIYSYFPKVQEYRASYSNWTTTGLLSSTSTLSVWPGTTAAITALNDLGFVVAVAGAGINITHRLQYRKKAGSVYSSPYDYIHVKYILKVGTNYWNGSGWQSAATSFNSNSLFIEDYATFSYQDLGDYPQASFQTTELLSSGNVYFQAFYYENAWYADNYTTDYEIRILANTPSYPSSVQFTINESLLAERIFSSSNSTTIANTIEDLGECLLGDGPTNNNPSWGRLRVTSDGTNWENAIEENWQAWETGTESRITTILCEQALFGQNNYIPLNIVFLRNKQAHSFSFATCFDDNTNGGDRMVCQGYTFNAAKDEVSGQYFKAAQDTSGVANTTDTLTEVTYQVGEVQ